MTVIYELLGQKTAPEHQTDSTLVTATPVSGTKYAVLDTTDNVRIVSIACKITWATTQPTPLEIWITIDGNTIKCSKSNPVSGSWYMVRRQAPSGDEALDDTDYTLYEPFFYEGRSVKVEHEITWATTQPTNLTTRIKYAKW